MSLVGPRPLPVRDYVLLEDWHRRRYRVLPGMTGLWQISGRSSLTFDDLVRLDFYYLENWSSGSTSRSSRRRVPAVLSRRTRCRTKTPKIVAVASAADLDFRYGCTPAWWQLWKGLHDGRRRPDRDAVPRQGDRVAVVAYGAESAVPRGRGVRARARHRRPAKGDRTCDVRRSSPRTRAPTRRCAR